MAEDDPERCPECGAEYFHAVPGKTTQEEIVEFLKRVGSDTSDPCLHPGAYCPNGCQTGYIAHYPLELPREITDRRYDLVLTSPGSDDGRIILFLKRSLGWSLADARDRIRRGTMPMQICDGALWQLQDMRDELVALGASATINDEPQNSTFDEAVGRAIDDRYPKG